MMSFKGIAEGVENTNYLLHTERGYYILTLYEKRVAKQDLPFFIGLMEHLAARGINCPQPVKNRNAAALGEIAGRPATLVTFLEGLWIRRPSVAHCGALGEAMAELHKAGNGFSLRRDNALGSKSWKNLAQSVSGRADEIAPGLAALIREEAGEMEQSWPRSLPEGVIHADLFPDKRVFSSATAFRPDRLYFACNDFFAYDIAIALNAWCFEIDGSFNVTKGRALLSGYNAVRKLDAKKSRHCRCFARGAALRFLLTRTIDWLNVPPGAMCDRRIRWNIRRSSISTAASRMRANTDCPHEARRHE